MYGMNDKGIELVMRKVRENSSGAISDERKAPKRSTASPEYSPVKSTRLAINGCIPAG